MTDFEQTIGSAHPSHEVTHDAQTARSSHRPVLGYAALGAAFLALNITLVSAWIFSEDFERVPYGPDEPPQWMKVVLGTTQAVLPVVAMGFLYWFLVRPWRRERRVTFDGLMCIAGFTASIWDVFSSGMNPWFSYNSYLLNYGNPLSYLPGWLSLNEPGQAIAWSFPTLPCFYLIMFPLMGIFGCAMLRGVKRLLPHIHGVRFVVAGFIAMGVFGFVFESIFLPLGFWTYPGGAWPLVFGGQYFQFPANELFHATAVYTVIAFLRYRINDRGQSFVERGIDQIQGGVLKKSAIRFLALVAAVHVTCLTMYGIPETFWGLNSREYPQDVKDRSYFMNQCGPRMDRACPGPEVPIVRPGSGHINWSGEFVPQRSGNGG